ncbi:MAG: hypothetical protein M1827_003818 [Pycnora praestabilis]|nr:MAG: hypothetical protein M1827_003818 [Pycnora praestabilis]
MARAWFTPSSLGPVRSSSGSTTDDEDPASSTDADVDIAKIRTSLSYINNLITTSITRHHIPASRVIVGGFSQGAVMSLLTGMLDLSKLKDMEGGGGGGEEGIEEVHYTGRLGGIAALSGYVALPHKLTSASPAPSPSPANTPTPSTPSPAPSPTPNPTQIFLAHGTKDMLVPMSLARRGKEQITELVGDQRVEWREYQGMGHVHCGAEMMDLCRWVGRVVKSDD